MEMDNYEETEDNSSSWESMDEEEDCQYLTCKTVFENSLILERVLSNLSHDDLLACRLVNKQWDKAALVRDLLGAKTSVRVTEDNFDELLSTAQNSLQPFCRQFDFYMVELNSRLIAFRKIFKHVVSSLSFQYCAAPLPKTVTKLLCSPNLREVKISGALINFKNDAVFRKVPLGRLTHIELRSSLDYGHVSQDFMKTILQNSPKLHSICISRSASLWRGFIEVLSQVGLSATVEDIKVVGIDTPLMIEEFAQVFLIIKAQKVTIQDCIVGQEFLQGLLSLVFNTLQELNIQGTQHEILTRVFYETRLPRLTQLTLPIDGFSTQDGTNILQSLPKLKSFKVLGLFQTVFTLRNGNLITLSAEEFDTTTAFTQASFRIALAAEKRREFLKVLSLLPLTPLRVELDLPELNSCCLRSLFSSYPDLEELMVSKNSRQSLDAWTGIPIKMCRKIAACRSYSVLKHEGVQTLNSLKSLKKLKRFELTILGEPPKAEFTLLYILYGICELSSLEDLRLNNFKMSDIGFLALSRSLNLKVCQINGTEDQWAEYQLKSQNLNIRTFLLPPKFEKSQLSYSNPTDNAVILKKILYCLPRSEVFAARIISKMWYSTAREVLHEKCEDSIIGSASELEKLDIFLDRQKKSEQHTPNKTPQKILSDSKTPCLARVLNLLSKEPSITKLIFKGMNKSLLEYYQRENAFGRGHCLEPGCEDRRRVSYWFYPDGSDELIVSNFEERPKPTSIVVIGSWARKDIGLLEFLNPSHNINSVVLFGLLQEVYDLVLPKLTAMQNIVSVAIIPFSASSVSEISRNHLQILANSSFSLKHLSMQKLQVPPETIADLIRSHRYTLETLNIQNHVNVSDRLSFSIPNLKRLMLDEPPGALLWTTLNINQSLESIHFERSGYIYNQVKSKAIPKLDLVEQDFEHSASEVLCDVNLFLECVQNKRPGVQKSILQEGSDSALKFFSHFRFLTSLTLRSVHAHYGMLQGIFRHLKQLEKLVFTNTAGITDEILTGFPKSVLDKMDLLNPLQCRTVQMELHELSYPSIRNMKKLTHLSLDDQTFCTDLSVIFGILKLKQLKYFSCRKWKITDVSIRAMADLTNIEQIVTDGAMGVSQFGMEYWRNKQHTKMSESQ